MCDHSHAWYGSYSLFDDNKIMSGETKLGHVVCGNLKFDENDLMIKWML